MNIIIDILLVWLIIGFVCLFVLIHNFDKFKEYFKTTTAVDFLADIFYKKQIEAVKNIINLIKDKKKKLI